MKKQHLSIDCYRKLCRSSTLSSLFFLDMHKRGVNGINQLYIPYLFSYLADDLSDINDELKEKGLFDEWLKQGGFSSKSSNALEDVNAEWFERVRDEPAKE